MSWVSYIKSAWRPILTEKGIPGRCPDCTTMKKVSCIASTHFSLLLNSRYDVTSNFSFLDSPPWKSLPLNCWVNSFLSLVASVGLFCHSDRKINQDSHRVVACTIHICCRRLLIEKWIFQCMLLPLLSHCSSHRHSKMSPLSRVCTMTL